VSLDSNLFVKGMTDLSTALQGKFEAGFTDYLWKIVKDLPDDQISAIRDALLKNGVKTEGDLRKEVTLNIKRLIEIKSYRGMRHLAGLPVRGQRTHTNARTRKGPRRAAIAGKKKPGKK